MSKLTKSQLVDTIEALRAEIATLRLINEQCEARPNKTEARTPAPRTEGLPTWRVERRAQLARAKAEAARSGHWVKA